MNIPVQEIIKLRKDLHQHPEESGQERGTAIQIKSFLEKYSPDEIEENLGGYGIAAIYKGKNPGKNVLIRCELDALPILEINSFSHSSKNIGAGHMCGHDGHMAIVSGLSTLLSRERPEKGNVILLFQPAEENGVGARAVLAEERFLNIKPDFVFALHNLPGYKTNDIVLKKGAFTAAVNSMIIRLEGKTSHAGEPDNGINPALAMAEIIKQIDKLNNPDQKSENFRQVSYVHASMGEKAYGVSAGSGELGFTFRCWSTKERDLLGEEMAEIGRKVGLSYGLKVDIDYLESFHANQNADEAVDIIERAAKGEGLNIIWREYPHRWGEDFGILTDIYPGALFGLGAGENTPALHNPDYDFPDQLIETGIRMFYRIIQEVNK